MNVDLNKQIEGKLFTRLFSFSKEYIDQKKSTYLHHGHYWAFGDFFELFFYFSRVNVQNTSLINKKKPKILVCKLYLILSFTLRVQL